MRTTTWRPYWSISINTCVQAIIFTWKTVRSSTPTSGASSPVAKIAIASTPNTPTSLAATRPARWIRSSFERTIERACRPNSAGRHGGREFCEKVVGEFFGGALHQTLPELGKLAADLRLDIVSEKRAAVLVGEFDGST